MEPSLHNSLGKLFLLTEVNDQSLFLPNTHTHTHTRVCTHTQTHPHNTYSYTKYQPYPPPKKVNPSTFLRAAVYGGGGYISRGRSSWFLGEREIFVVLVEFHNV